MIRRIDAGRYVSAGRDVGPPRCGVAILAAVVLVAGCSPTRDTNGCEESACLADCRAGGYASGLCTDGLCNCVGGGDAGTDADATDADADATGADADATGADAEEAEAGCAERDLGSAIGRDLVAAGSTTADHVVSCGSRPDMPVAWTAPHGGIFRFLIRCEAVLDVSLAFVDGDACAGPLLACETYSCFCVDPIGTTPGRYEDCCFYSSPLWRMKPMTLAAGQRILVVLDETCTLSIEDGSLDEDGAACFNGADDDEDGYPDCRDFDCDDDCTETEAECHGGVDDDHDALTDCSDDDCVSYCVEICGNGLDDDGDGAADCDDPDCTGEPEVYHPDAGCLDGLDNDCDGETDCRDADCDFFNPYCPEDCENLVDDDDDGRIDCADGFCLEEPACL
jgi:hypothetical protein